MHGLGTNEGDYTYLAAPAYDLAGFSIRSKRYLSPAITEPLAHLSLPPSLPPSPNARRHHQFGITPVLSAKPSQHAPPPPAAQEFQESVQEGKRRSIGVDAFMKDLVSCFSEHAVRISDVACSGSGAANAAAVASSEPAGGGARAAAVSAVTTVYRSRLSASGKELLIEVTWSRAPDGPALSVAVHEAAAAWRHRADGTAAPRHLHKKKGSGTFTAGSCVVGVFWDYAAARYAGAGPEPASGFYVAVVADAEFVLLLGDLSRGYVDRLHGGIPIAGSRVARRRERFVGCGSWSTKARFLEAGAEHEIAVLLLDGDAEAWVTVDGRKVAQLRRLRWNFRGSLTIFLDGGAPVDMTWDLHGWLFHAGADPPHASSSAASCAVFTFQARGASETRLWTDDDGFTDGEEPEKPPATASRRRQKPGGGGAPGQGFCLLIQGFRGFSKST